MGNTPNIRFKGFTDDWEQRKLGDYIIEYHEINTVNNQYPVLTSSRKGIFLQTEYYSGNQVASDDNTGYNIVPYGYFTYRHMSDDEIFHFNINDIVENGIVSTLYPVFITSEDLDSRYLQYQLNYGREFAKFAVLQKQGGSRTYMYLNKLKKLELTMPKAIEEQKKISGYFIELDYLITLHQRKCDETKELKKFMLQKMFPKNGEKKPEIRFKGFTDDWEQRKLSEIYASIGNAFVGTATPYYVEQGHFYLESNNIKDGQINHNSEVFINDEFYERQKDKWLHTGDMVMVQSGHVGHAAVIPEELDNSAAHALIMFREPKVKIEPYFLNYQYQTNKIKKKIEGITTGNTIKHILASDMQEFVVDLPDYDEQKQIGDYFRNLDHLITLHQRKCDEIKEIKKFMLQNMFPQKG